eukprot:CAMPEP_0197576146 /NCGR_PEP_ID=MMETSP1326-20131121/1271_1 /TAXON_ID=1155430 /ORGANISM="Genus nov. species nov., Strain RCC2288" /LENGTH=364 /DNA_ID=CAMNT_0043139007 /DNA_START=510 /DNA_END=1604 /DNA_ORIENTATION=-
MRRHRRRSVSASDGIGGYVPRDRHEGVKRKAGLSVHDQRGSTKLPGGGNKADDDRAPAPPAVVLPVVDPAKAQAERQRLAQQWVLQQQAASMIPRLQGQADVAPGANKKHREIYVGNLLVGVVTGETLRQLFDSSLAVAFPNANPLIKPVINVQMAFDWKYAFVELQTEEMASAAIQLNGMELCGRQLNIARPSGYVNPSTAAAVAAQAALAVNMLVQGAALGAPGVVAAPQHPVGFLRVTGTTTTSAAAAGVDDFGTAAAGNADSSSNIVCLHNLVTEAELNDDEEYREVFLDLEAECSKCGTVEEMRIPRCSSDVGKVFVKFAGASEARAAIALMQGRMFDGRAVIATFVPVDMFTKVPTQA